MSERFDFRKLEGLADAQQTYIPIPEEVTHHSENGITITQYTMAQRFTVIRQHVHDRAHASHIAHGAVRVWINEKLAGDHQAPCTFFIEPGLEHCFLTLEPGTILQCLFNDREGA